MTIKKWGRSKFNQQRSCQHNWLMSLRVKQIYGRKWYVLSTEFFVGPSQTNKSQKLKLNRKQPIIRFFQQKAFPDNINQFKKNHDSTSQVRFISCYLSPKIKKSSSRRTYQKRWQHHIWSEASNRIAKTINNNKECHPKSSWRDATWRTEYNIVSTQGKGFLVC